MHRDGGKENILGNSFFLKKMLCVFNEAQSNISVKWITLYVEFTLMGIALTLPIFIAEEHS